MPGIKSINEAGTQPVVGQWVVFSDTNESTYPHPTVYVGCVIEVDSQFAIIYNDITDQWCGLDWPAIEYVVIEGPHYYCTN